MHPMTTLGVPAGQLAVHWFGQSSFAVKTPGGTLVLVDPYFPHTRPAEKYLKPEPPVQESDIPAVAALLTHDHSDHTHPESLLRAVETNPDLLLFGPHESATRTADAGIAQDQFTTVSAGDHHKVGDLDVHFVYAKPPEGDPAAGIEPPDVTHLGLVLRCGDASVYFSGDPINTFADREDLLAPVRSLAPKVGWLTCHPAEGEFPYFDGCVRTARSIGLEQVYPAHYDCFVKRTYDPAVWALQFTGQSPRPRIVGYNQTVLIP